MVWDAFIAIYLFLAGLGAGAFVLGALTNWAKKPAARMKRIAFIIAPVAVGEECPTTPNRLLYNPVLTARP